MDQTVIEGTNPHDSDAANSQLKRLTWTATWRSSNTAPVHRTANVYPLVVLTVS